MMQRDSYAFSLATDSPASFLDIQSLETQPRRTHHLKYLRCGLRIMPCEPRVPEEVISESVLPSLRSPTVQ